VAKILRGWALTEQGHEAQGIAQICDGMAAQRATGAQLIQPYWTSLLAWTHSKNGEVDQGLHLVSEALQTMQDQHVWEAELQRLKGELLLLDVRTGSSKAGIASAACIIQAEIGFQQALKIAIGQSAKSIELRAATSLAKLLQLPGRSSQRRVSGAIKGSAPKPVISSHRSTAGSPKVSTRQTSRRCSTSWRDPVSSLLLGGDPRFCHAPSVADVPRGIGDALSPRESSVSRKCQFCAKERNRSRGRRCGTEHERSSSR
jgi:hypothetical protein